MKRFNHIAIAQQINSEFNLTSYAKGKFIFFCREPRVEMGFIENISASKQYLQTFYSSFYDFDMGADWNDKVCERVKALYKEQAEKITTPKNVMLAFANNVSRELI